jgi:hypothetical protein
MCPECLTQFNSACPLLTPPKTSSNSFFSVSSSASLYSWTAIVAKEILIMTDYRVAKGEAQEDQVTAAIEKFTSQVPSSVYLGLALASMAVSVVLQVSKKQHESLFIGQWAAPFLILGIYNKLVKIHGSDATQDNGSHHAA